MSLYYVLTPSNLKPKKEKHQKKMDKWSGVFSMYSINILIIGNNNAHWRRINEKVNDQSINWVYFSVTSICYTK